MKLGHTPDAVEKIKCDTFKLKFFGQCVPFIAALALAARLNKR